MTYPKRVAEQVVRMAGEMGIERAVPEALSSRGTGSGEYRVVLLHGGRRGLVRVATFFDPRMRDSRRPTLFSAREGTLITDVTEWIQWKGQQTARPAVEALGAIADWAGIDRREAVRVAGLHRVPLSGSAGTLDECVAVIRREPGRSSEIVGRVGAGDRVPGRSMFLMALALRIVDEEGFGPALDMECDESLHLEIENDLVNTWVRRLSEPFAATTDEAGMERLRFAAAEALSEYAVETRCRVGEIVARVVGRESVDANMFDGFEHWIAGFSVSDRVALAALALHYRPASAESAPMHPWHLVTAAQYAVSVRMAAPDGATGMLEPYRDTVEMHRDLGMAAVDGAVRVAVPGGTRSGG